MSCAPICFCSGHVLSQHAGSLPTGTVHVIMICSSLWVSVTSHTHWARLGSPNPFYSRSLSSPVPLCWNYTYYHSEAHWTPYCSTFQTQPCKMRHAQDKHNRSVILVRLTYSLSPFSENQCSSGLDVPVAQLIWIICDEIPVFLFEAP
jgi:hypothetical protein